MNKEVRKELIGKWCRDTYDGKRKKIFAVSSNLLFIGKDREPVRIHEIVIL